MVRMSVIPQLPASSFCTSAVPSSGITASAPAAISPRGQWPPARPLHVSQPLPQFLLLVARRVREPAVLSAATSLAPQLQDLPLRGMRRGTMRGNLRGPLPSPSVQNHASVDSSVPPVLLRAVAAGGSPVAPPRSGSAYELSLAEGGSLHAPYPPGPAPAWDTGLSDCPCADCINGLPPRDPASQGLPPSMEDDYVMELHARHSDGTLTPPTPPYSAPASAASPSPPSAGLSESHLAELEEIALANSLHASKRQRLLSQGGC